MKNGKTITICSSASFYRQVLEAEEKLRSAGFNVLIPDTARRMQQSGNFEVSAYKTWYSNDSHWGKKNRTHEKSLCEGNGRRRDVGAQLREELCCRIHWRKCTHGDGARFSLSKAYLCALPR